MALPGNIKALEIDTLRGIAWNLSVPEGDTLTATPDR